MAITFVGRTQASSNSGTTTIAISTPAGIAAGDLMLVMVVNTLASVPAAPSGWTQINGYVSISGEVTSLFFKKYVVADGTSYTFGAANNLGFPKAVMRAYRTAVTVDANNHNTATSSTSLQIPALTATIIGAEWYVGFWTNAQGAITGPGDLVNTTADSTQWLTFDGDKVMGATGSVPGAETATAVSANWTGIAVTIIPYEALPQFFFHRIRRQHPVLLRAKRSVRNRIEFITRPNFIESPVLRHRQQPHRVVIAKAKRSLRTRWIVDRQVTAPHADFPPILRHRQPRKPISKVKAKPAMRGRLKPPALSAVPAELRSRRQPKRILQVRAKRPVRERLTLPPQPKKVLPLPVFARQRIKRRIHLIGKKSWILVFYGSAVVPPPATFVDIARWRGTARRGSAIHGSN